MTAPNATSFRKRYYEHIAGRVLGSTSPNAGDCIYFDWNNQVYEVCDSDYLAYSFSGVSNDTNPIPSLNEDAAATRGIRINRHGIFEFYATSGDTYLEGIWVYVGADAQTVTTSGNNPIGIAVMPDMIQSITGGVGVKVPVAIAPLYPTECYMWFNGHSQEDIKAKFTLGLRPKVS